MTDQTRVAAGIPTGGQFAAQKRPDSEVSLAPPQAELTGAVIARPYLFSDELPPLPDAVSAPHNVKAWFDEGGDGDLFVAATFTHDGKEFTVSVGQDAAGDFNDSITDGSESTPLTADDDARITEWLYAVHSRVAATDHTVITAARDALLDEAVQVALGRREPKLIATPAADLDHFSEGAPFGAQRAHQMLAAGGYIDDSDERGEAFTYAIADALANLRHLADQEGLDFAALDRQAYGYYSDEAAQARNGG